MVFDPTSTNEKPDNATNNHKADNLLEAPIAPAGRPKHTLSPSCKVHEILKEKAVTLAGDLDWAKVYVFAAEIEKMKALKPSNLKEAISQTD